jgi:hypothetical protein
MDRVHAPPGHQLPCVGRVVVPGDDADPETGYPRDFLEIVFSRWPESSNVVSGINNQIGFLLSVEKSNQCTNFLDSPIGKRHDSEIHTAIGDRLNLSE